MQRVQKEKQTKEAEEDIEELDTPEKRDLTDIDALLDEIDEVLEEGTIAEQMAKEAYKDKLKSINFGATKEVPTTLAVTNLVVCRFRCENCTCGR